MVVQQPAGSVFSIHDGPEHHSQTTTVRLQILQQTLGIAHLVVQLLLADAPLIEPKRHRDAQHHDHKLQRIANGEVRRRSQVVSHGNRLVSFMPKGDEAKILSAHGQSEELLHSQWLST